MAVNPNNLMNLYELASADLSMTPIDPNGFWYCGKAISIAQLQYKAAVGMMSFFCKLEFQKHGGKLEEWDRLVSNTQKDTAPPQNFAKSLSLQEPNQALQEPNPNPGGVAQPPASYQGDPFSKLLISLVGTGASSGSGSNSRYDWYVQLVKNKVAASWHVPTDKNATDRPVLISFEIQPDGAPSNIRIEQSSGVAVLDEAAMRAVRGIENFGPPPTHEKIAVKFVFDSRDKK